MKEDKSKNKVAGAIDYSLPEKSIQTNIHSSNNNSNSETKQGHPHDRYWYLRTPEEVLTELGTYRDGLSDAEAGERFTRDGPNSLAKDSGYSALKRLLRQANNLVIYILFGVAIISYLSNHMVELVVVLFIIAFTVLFGFIQEYRAEQTIAALARFTPKKVEVIRQGKKIILEAEQIVRGDIIVLKRGMIVPADLRIIESTGLQVDESILTGESVAKQKNAQVVLDQDIPLADRSNMAYSGTSITNGNGLGVVVETGLKSEIGKISLTLQQLGDKRSPLQHKVDAMSKKISYAVLVIVAFFFVFLIAQEVSLFEAMILVGAVAVSGIPESFPLVMTLALSSGVKRMASKKAIVKDLSSVETLGTTTVICTDKTGTLTENRMRVVIAHFPDGTEYNVVGSGYEPQANFLLDGKTVPKEKMRQREQFFKGAILCNNEELIFENGEWKVRGDATEGALLALAKSAEYDDAVMRENEKRVYELPFDSLNKYMIVVNEGIEKKKLVQTAYCKGASERVINMCTHMRLASGKTKKLTASDKIKFHSIIESYSSHALRVLAVASKKFPSRIITKGKELNKVQDKKIRTGYVLEGIVGMEDPIRPEVIKAIQECETAGVRVVMITGDHRITAESIGRRLNLIKPTSNKIMLGEELERLSDQELDKNIGEVAIFARATPEHKLRIVSSLQRNGEIVAMTGDGVNDAPALKKADIGVAMGKNGTDVARESSNMVLADDNFSTIVEAVREGRTIYSNIRRFLFYLLTGNLTEVALILVTVMIGLTIPLTALMILFINVLTSSLPAIALSVEPTREKVMQQRPRSPKEELLSKYILLKILVIIPVLFAGTLMLFLWELNFQGATIEKARTVAFAAIILFEMMHAFNARSLHETMFNRSFFSNKLIFIAVGFSLLLMLVAIYTPFGQNIFETVPLNLRDWLIIGAVSSTVIIISEIIKLQVKSELDEQRSLDHVHTPHS